MSRDPARTSTFTPAPTPPPSCVSALIRVCLFSTPLRLLRRSTTTRPVGGSQAPGGTSSSKTDSRSVSHQTPAISSSCGATMGGSEVSAVWFAHLALSLLCGGVSSLPQPLPRVFLTFEGRKNLVRVLVLNKCLMVCVCGGGLPAVYGLVWLALAFDL